MKLKRIIDMYRYMHMIGGWIIVLEGFNRSARRAYYDLAEEY